MQPGWLRAQSGKPLKLILSVPPGAALDASARLLADKLKTSLDRTVIIDYKVGGAGLSAGEFVKGTDPDGSHLLFTPTSFFSYHTFLYAKLNYDPDRDLLPVCEGVTIPTATTVSAASGIASFKDWVEAIRRDPKMRFIGTPGPSGVGVFLSLLMGKTFGVGRVRGVDGRGEIGGACMRGALLRRRHSRQRRHRGPLPGDGPLR